MATTNLGRVQGAGFFYTTASSGTSVALSTITPTSIKPLVGDCIIFPNGDVRKITAVSASAATCGAVSTSLVNLKTKTKVLTTADITVAQGEFTVADTTLLLTYNDDYSIINISGRIGINVSATVSGIIGVKINLDPVKILRNYSNYQASIGYVYKTNFFEGLTCELLKNTGLILHNRASYKNLDNGHAIFEVNGTFFLREV